MEMDWKSFIIGAIVGAAGVEFVEHYVLKKYPGDRSNDVLSHDYHFYD